MLKEVFTRWLVTGACLLLLSSVAHTTPRSDSHERGLAAFRRGQFELAAKEFQTEVELIEASVDRGTQQEMVAREYLMFALYEANDKNEAAAEYRALCSKFPNYRLNEDVALPETIADLNARVPRDSDGRPLIVSAKEEGVSPSQTVVGSETARPLRPTWKPTYLLPLGVGQFMAGSPIRGTALAVTQTGLLATYIASYVAFSSQVDSRRTALNPAHASTWQSVANTALIAGLAVLVVGVVDGLFFEPEPCGMMSAGNTP